MDDRLVHRLGRRIDFKRSVLTVRGARPRIGTVIEHVTRPAWEINRARDCRTTHCVGVNHQVVC